MLRDLDLPSDEADSKAAEAYLTQVEKVIPIAEELERAAGAGDQAAAEKAVQDAQREGDKADALAKSYGFKECGSDDEASGSETTAAEEDAAATGTTADASEGGCVDR